MHMREHFYQYAVENPRIFEAMLWYNKYESEELFAGNRKKIYHFFLLCRPISLRSTGALRITCFVPTGLFWRDFTSGDPSFF